MLRSAHYRDQPFRERTFAAALREILLNAVMRRDYSHCSGYVAIVVFDDRIEIRSFGRLPNGVTVKQLSGRHDSRPTNPLMAGAFHRTGAVKVWGRGTNRVIAMCKQHGAPPPIFEERQGFVVVTFRAPLVAAQVTPQVDQQVTPQVKTVLEAATQAANAEALQRAAGLKGRVHFLKSYLQPLLEQGWLERAIPDKPRSRLQRYRTTVAGSTVVKAHGRAA